MLFDGKLFFSIGFTILTPSPILLSKSCRKKNNHDIDLSSLIYKETYLFQSLDITGIWFWVQRYKNHFHIIYFPNTTKMNWRLTLSLVQTHFLKPKEAMYQVWLKLANGLKK